MKFDSTYSINQQVLSIFEKLKELGNKDETDQHVSVYTWYNGREMGLTFSTFNQMKTHRMYIVIFEHRNSDRVCIVQWTEGAWARMNPPSPRELPEGVFESKYDFVKAFDFGMHDEAAQWVFDELKKYNEE